jgi:lipoprotein-anchoring transpeptidase ErfK/SrfK
MAAQDAGVTTHLSDAGPTVGSDASLTALGATPAPRSYPTTNSTFNLPDPNGVVSSFNASPGGLDLPQTNLALASGTSESRSLDAPPTEQGLSQDSALDASRSGGASDLGLANAIRTADIQYAEDKRKDALATLSIFYNTPNLSGEQRSELLSRLDPLARDVIYSRRHLLEQPHRVGQNETLMQIAARYEVPWQLLANINQIKDPVAVLPGTELKVVRGPFRADVNVSQKELTLFLGDLYAGRFPIGVGNDPAPKPGTFTIQDKQASRTFYDAAGSPIPPGSPNNPYGEVWLDLGGQLCIHGSPSTTSPSEKGCISLAADYADDLYGILSQGSSVTIRR